MGREARSSGDENLKKLAALCGLAGPITVFALIFYSVSMAPWFSWTENALSDLGVDEKAGLPFNSALILGGILYAIFTIGFGVTQPKNMLKETGLCLMFMDAAALCAMGVLPENIKPWHVYASVAFFVLIPLSQFAVGSAFLAEKNRKLGLFTVLLGLVCTAIWGYRWKAVAIPEAIAAFALAVWIVVLSLKTYKE